MADQSLNRTPSNDEKYIAEEKHISTPSSINGHRTPEAVAAEYGLSEKKLLRKLDLYLVPGVAVSSSQTDTPESTIVTLIQTSSYTSSHSSTAPTSQTPVSKASRKTSD
jgi:hypothetical protein